MTLNLLKIKMMRKNKKYIFPIIVVKHLSTKSREQKYKGSEILDFDSMI